MTLLYRFWESLSLFNWMLTAFFLVSTYAIARCDSTVVHNGGSHILRGSERRDGWSWDKAADCAEEVIMRHPSPLVQLALTNKQVLFKEDLILEEELIKFLVLGTCPLTWGVFHVLGFSFRLDPRWWDFELNFQCDSSCLDLWNRRRFLDTAFVFWLILIKVQLQSLLILLIAGSIFMQYGCLFTVTFYLKRIIYKRYKSVSNLDFFQIHFAVFWSFATCVSFCFILIDLNEAEPI